jgi:hypothetical protein
MTIRIAYHGPSRTNHERIRTHPRLCTISPRMQMSCVYLMHRQSQPMYRVCNPLLSLPHARGRVRVRLMSMGARGGQNFLCRTSSTICGRGEEWGFVISIQDPCWGNTQKEKARKFRPCPSSSKWPTSDRNPQQQQRRVSQGLQDSHSGLGSPEFAASPPPIFSLSSELLIEIASNLFPNDIDACRQTCYKSNELIVDSELVRYILPYRPFRRV